MRRYAKNSIEQGFCKRADSISFDEVEKGGEGRTGGKGGRGGGRWGPLGPPPFGHPSNLWRYARLPPVFICRRVLPPIPELRGCGSSPVGRVEVINETGGEKNPAY